jgi:hypothetical protein
MQSPESVARQIAAIEALVEQGAWNEIEAIVRGLPALVESFAEQDRKPALLALKRFLDLLEAKVERLSSEIGAELGALRGGQKAAGQYRACARMAADFDVTSDM